MSPAERGTPARTGVWIGIAAITMSFAAYTSAMLVRQAEAADWRHLALPPLLYLNTLVLLASSVSMELGRRELAVARAEARARVRPLRRPAAGARAWLRVTLALGLLFVVGQVAAWRELAARGVFLASSPASGFFYVLTALHALHLAGGIAALALALRRLGRQPAAAQGAVGAVALYWHFMDALWLYLLALLTALL